MSQAAKHDRKKNAPASSSSDFVKIYIGIISLVSSLLIIAIFWGFYSHTVQLIEDQLHHEARAFFQEIVQTRHWIIKQEGVYIKKKAGMLPDPNLENIKELKTLITDREGEEYILRNHAVITRSISDLAQRERHFIINITSLKPMDPDNQPDDFERTALESFETGAQEYSRLRHISSDPTFRYMAPLVTRKECLPCHGAQGYKIGDIRGGISITISARQALHQIIQTRIYTVIAAIALLTVLLSVIFYISKQFVHKLKKSETRLVELATTDSLTGILNRGEGIRRFEQEISRSRRKQQPLSIILIDIDNFKKFNDNLGHQVGDQVIRLVAGLLTATLRNYDIICRYGGEEFLVVLPATELPKAIETAERLRILVAELTTAGGGREAAINLTISLGISSLQPGDSLDGLIYRADNALYIAKQEGRNQVQFIA
jgi:diguanylate cyclase (GGDEF)-like protein